MRSSSFKLNSTPKKSHKKLVLLISAVLVLLVLIGAFLYVRHRNNSRASIKTDDAAQTHSAKKDTIEQDKSGQSTSNLPVNSTGVTSDQVPESEAFKISKIDFNQIEDTITTSATLTGTTSTGTCVFSFKAPEEKPIVKQVESSAQQCQATFSKFEFSKLGSWNLSVVRYQGDEKTEAMRDVTIN